MKLNKRFPEIDCRIRFIKPQKNKLYFSLVNLKTVADHIAHNLKVSTSSKQSSILNLSYRDEVVCSKLVRGEAPEGFRLAVLSEVSVEVSSIVVNPYIPTEQTMPMISM